MSREDIEQDMDVDLIIARPEGDYILLEVKGDRYTTGNFFIELVSNTEKCSIGCILKTQADYILYYFIKTYTLYSLAVQGLKYWIKDNARYYPIKTVQTHLENGSVYHTEGICVPITRLVTIGHAKELKLDE
jgi:hypothetical protein